MKSAWIIAAVFLPFALSAGEQGKEHGNAFDRIDADHDGVISHAEARTAPRLANSFNALDTDHNGSLSRDELEQHAENKRREMHDQMEQKFKSADANGDGQLSAEEAKGMPRLAKDFAAVDKNGDGLVSREELRQRAKVMHKTTMEGHDDHGEHKSGDKPDENKPQ
jgi:Ca2+-binding EF-hand superfamily protein